MVRLAQLPYGGTHASELGGIGWHVGWHWLALAGTGWALLWHALA